MVISKKRKEIIRMISNMNDVDPFILMFIVQKKTKLSKCFLSPTTMHDTKISRKVQTDHQFINKFFCTFFFFNFSFFSLSSISLASLLSSCCCFNLSCSASFLSVATTPSSVSRSYHERFKLKN